MMSLLRRVILIVPLLLQRAAAQQFQVDTLQQNIPSPFTAAASITYTIPHGGVVRLTLFNLLGQEVALVFEGEQNAGTYEAGFDKADLPTGMYFYRIQAPGFVETKKMTITK